MFKILLLQRYYNLSDEQTEFQINDRKSFKKFLGLKIEDKITNKNSVWMNSYASYLTSLDVRESLEKIKKRINKFIFHCLPGFMTLLSNNQ